MTKNECRKIFREKRKLLSWLELQKWDDLLLIQFQKIDLPFVEYIHTYLAIENEKEIDTSPILEYLKFRNPGLITLVPRINFATGHFEQVVLDEDTELVPNGFGIPEPAAGETVPADETDIVLLPLLAFDQRGYRVGYGKGYYDKFLEGCREDVIKIGLSYFEPVECIDDGTGYDVPLDYCVTPFMLYDFSNIDHEL